MRFALTDEQRGFARSLDDLLAKAGTPDVVRAWAAGDHSPGLELWQRLHALGVNALLVEEEHDGLGATPVELVVAFEALGRHAVPGPWVESAAYLASCGCPELSRAVAAGELLTVAAAPHTPRALDADVASRVLLVVDGRLREATPGTRHASVDPARRLFDAEARGEVAPARGRGFDPAALACSAQLLGLGEHLLAASVEYAAQRTQFGRPVGSFQALKHALADVRIGLDFARPLVYGAALAVTGSSGSAPADVSAAKVAAGDAAYRAARTALQVHGAVGYTAEHDLGLWILKVRALVGAWGTPSAHRARILARLVRPVETVA
jgi:alkylation response protein AidB-like acyl-CoA dehydrogenase